MADNSSKGFPIIKDLLKDCQKIAIAGHVSPDGDAVGACFALALCMAAIGKEPIVLLDDYSRRYDFLPGKEYLYKGSIDDIKADAFIAIDTSSKDRLANFSAVFDDTELTINIDHHISNTNFAKYNFVPEASSASEVIFDVIKEFMPLNKDIAACIYTGIIFDTGVFRHSSTTPATHEKVAQLIRTGIDFTSIHHEVVETRSVAEAKIFGIALNNLEIADNYPVAYTFVSLNDMKNADADFKDLDGIVEYILNIRGMKAVFFISERDGGVVKASFRSRDIDVNKIAGSFGGGGHIRAAGATINAKIDDACAAVLSAVKKEFDSYGH